MFVFFLWTLFRFIKVKVQWFNIVCGVLKSLFKKITSDKRKEKSKRSK